MPAVTVRQLQISQAPDLIKPSRHGIAVAHSLLPAGLDARLVKTVVPSLRIRTISANPIVILAHNLQDATLDVDNCRSPVNENAQSNRRPTQGRFRRQAIEYD